MGSLWGGLLGAGLLAWLIWRLLHRQPGKAAAPASRPVGAGAAHGQSPQVPAVPRGYSPGNVGNDASARPWESTDSKPLSDAAPGAVRVPDGFDVESFLSESKTHFVSLQGAWDRADIASLRAMMTDGMLQQIQGQLTERERQSGGQPDTTEVVMIEARLLGIQAQEEGHLASVEFSGLLRERGAGPSPFREIWDIVRVKSGAAGWRVAGVQALQ